ncbi:hypothetical protein KYK29_10475 [Shinella daejeonensis]|uniref:hypothetical protein n=1 Tax=Shinella daejeonensis TaxID=659017 RepID=UPI0020C7D455|nr:hypothetical protein [Shinella daejeonensis]MCP8895359.1 hypothetical protein [Shinella daejeonensis]
MNGTTTMSEKSLPDFSQAGLKCLYTITGALQYGDEAAAIRALGASWREVPREEQLRIRDFINEHVLAEKSREMSIHGIKRTFRFWSEEEKAGLIRFAKLVIDRLQSQMGFSATIGYGTALGIAREGDLIPHDDDVDLICAIPTSVHPDFPSALTAIREAFSGKADIYTFGKHPGHLKFGQQPYALDVFVALQEGEFISSYPGPRKEILFTDVFPSKLMNVFGVEIDAPADMEAYLSKVYGPNWRVPDPMFGHKWGGLGFEDLISDQSTS